MATCDIRVRVLCPCAVAVCDIRVRVLSPCTAVVCHTHVPVPWLPVTPVMCHIHVSHLSLCAMVTCHIRAHVPCPSGIAMSVSCGPTHVPVSVCPSRAPHALSSPAPQCLGLGAVPGDSDKVLARVPWPWRGGRRVLRARGSVTREGGATSPPQAIKLRRVQEPPCPRHCHPTARPYLSPLPPPS